jgi:hypothetical protein
MNPADLDSGDRWTSPLARRRFSPAFASMALVAVAVAVLRGQGRIWWCSCGESSLWSGDVWSSHNSQHLFDPYSLSHFAHGIIFFWGLHVIAPRLSVGWRFVAALILENLWEVTENTPMVIQRYREATASLDYFGDSIGNSLGDMISCGLGFFVAGWIGWRASAVLFVGLELYSLYSIRDCLVLNVLMLLYPIDAIKAWQEAGAPTH